MCLRGSIKSNFVGLVPSGCWSFLNVYFLLSFIFTKAQVNTSLTLSIAVSPLLHSVHGVNYSIPPKITRPLFDNRVAWGGILQSSKACQLSLDTNIYDMAHTWPCLFRLILSASALWHAFSIVSVSEQKALTKCYLIYTFLAAVYLDTIAVRIICWLYVHPKAPHWFVKPHSSCFTNDNI